MKRAGVCVALLIAALSPTAASGNNFGFRYASPSCCTLKGTRASITSPGWNVSANGGHIALMRVAAQSGNGYGGLVQTGWGTAAVYQLDTCGTRSANTVFWEYIPASTGVPVCKWLNTFGGTGTDYKYSVVRAPTSACGGGTTCWYIFVDGSLKATTEALGFSEANYNPYAILAGGEIGGSSTNGGSLTGGYGIFNGDTPWQRTADVYGPNMTWTTITSTTSCRSDDGLWWLSQTPSPFSVTHPTSPGTAC